MKKVAVGISGGVDSSVAAFLLKERGFDVVGVTMLVGGPGEEEMLAAAKEFADSLSMKHFVVDFKDMFAKEVVEYIRSEYASARTPNPCIRCNEKIKLGALAEHAFSALGCDAVATGHYARVDSSCLYRAADRTKDQSYFLYRVDKGVLRRLILPLGELSKERVRGIALENSFASAKKPDSQDFCFGNIKSLLSGASSRNGSIVTLSGETIGSHEGIDSFTVGMRKGLGLPGGTDPYYVIKIDASTNTVVVGPKSAAVSFSLRLENTVGKIDFSLPVKVRSASEPRLISDGLFAVTPGQSAVFYDGDKVVGGGIIC